MQLFAGANQVGTDSVNTQGVFTVGVNSPLAIGGQVSFGTNSPKTSSLPCTPDLGTAMRYDVQFDLTTSPASITVSKTEAPGGGLLPSPKAGVVEIDNGDGTTSNYLYAIDNPLSPGGPNITINPSGKRYRVYWKEVLQ